MGIGTLITAHVRGTHGRKDISAFVKDVVILNAIEHAEPTGIKVANANGLVAIVLSLGLTFSFLF
mgnify:CR=1 FL=1